GPRAPSSGERHCTQLIPAGRPEGGTDDWGPPPNSRASIGQGQNWGAAERTAACTRRNRSSPGWDRLWWKQIFVENGALLPPAGEVPGTDLAALELFGGSIVD